MFGAKIDREVTRYVVVHIPKTAGTSLQSMMARGFGQGRVSPTFGAFHFTEIQAKKFDSFQVIFGHISIDDIDKFFSDRKRICFFRDPIERCVSWCHYIRSRPLEKIVPLCSIRNKNCPTEAISLARQLPIEEFLQYGHPHVEQNLRNRQTWQIGSHACVELRKMSEADVLGRALAAVQLFDFVGMQETFSFDSLRLFGWLGVKQIPTIEEQNRTARGREFAALSSSARDLLMDMNRLDMQVVGAVQRRHRDLGG